MFAPTIDYDAPGVVDSPGDIARYEAMLDDARAEFDHRRREALIDAEGIADWLLDQCVDEKPYRYSADEWLHECQLRNGSPEGISTACLLALALGLAESQKARIAAIDELARRAGVPQ